MERQTPRHEFIIDFCGDLKGKKILDIGCSFGWFEKHAIENKSKKIVGIEPEEKYFRVCDQRAGAHLSQAQFEAGGLYDMQGSAFDRLLSE